MNKRQLSRLKLIGILSAFAGPLLIAAALYFGQDWFKFGSTAQGYLLSAGQTLHSNNFRLIKDEQKPETGETSLLDGRWLLLFNGSATCDLHCQANLFKMRQARLVLGRDSARVRTVYLLPAAQPDAELSRILLQYPAFSAYQIDAMTKQTAQTSELKQNQVYIVDPMGNLVMRYLPDAYSRDIIKDFKRLLKASKIG